MINIFKSRYIFEYHKNLEPHIWNSKREMNPNIRQSLLMLMWDYIGFMHNNGMPIDINDVRDIIVHGSIADYYYDKHSDIDICIIADMTKWKDKFDGVNQSMLYKSLLHSWKRGFNMNFYGRSIDVTLADVDKPEYSKSFYKTGSAYSLINKKWIHTPTDLRPDALRKIRKDAKKQAKQIMRRCKTIIKNDMAFGYIDAFFDNIQSERVADMHEHYTQPLTEKTMGYKMARNTGIFAKLRARSRISRSKNFNLT